MVEQEKKLDSVGQLETKVYLQIPVINNLRVKKLYVQPVKVLGPVKISIVYYLGCKPIPVSLYSDNYVYDLLLKAFSYSELPLDSIVSVW